MAESQVIPFFTFPPSVRKIIYTTNAPSWRIQAFTCRAMIESLNRVIRKTTKTRGSFPTPSQAFFECPAGQRMTQPPS